jgi:repressor LexA
MKHLRALEENGLLVKHTGKKRAWRLTDGQGPAVIPVYGGIAAGLPITAASQKEDEIPVDPVMFGAGEIFALRVKGDSMIDAHIQDGDLAMIRSQRQAENGDVVAALIEGVEAEATLKILRRRPGYIELHPANENYPILTFRGVDQARVRIVGKLAGIIRTRIQV